MRLAKAGQCPETALVTHRLDLTGLRCPLPVIRLEAAMRKSAPGEAIEVTADDPLARIDIPHAAREANFSCSEIPCELRECFAFRVIAPDE